MVDRRSLLLAFLIGAAAAAQPTFTPMPQSDAGVVGGGKEGGAIVVDLTGDPCPEIVVNTLTDSRLLLGSCDGGFPLFTDVTEAYASGMTRTIAERSVVAADLNNDGARDVVRNTSSRLEVFLNAGPSAVPPYRLGDTAGDPQRVVVAADFETGINLEGVAVLDYDSDGWLDLAVQNSGVDLLQNPRDGTAAFTVATSSADRHGLPTGLVNGDYATAADVDADGDVDLLVRNTAGPVLWLNDGTGRFVGAASFTPVADPSIKSGTALCDFDGDGELDIYWGGVSAAQPDELWTQRQPGVFAREPAPNGNGFSTDMACGDLDHDGDVDLALANAAGVRLLINQGAGTFVAFDPPELAGGPAHAVVLADMDHDGDLDLYVNRTGENGLWRNDLDDGRSLSVALRTRLPGRAERDAIGASAVLLSCPGDVLLSPRRELSGGRGHGTQDPPVLHFGLPPGPPRPLLIEARFVGGAIRRRAVDPAGLPPGSTVVVREGDPDLFYACNQPVVVPLANPLWRLRSAAAQWRGAGAGRSERRAVDPHLRHLDGRRHPGDLADGAWRAIAPTVQARATRLGNGRVGGCPGTLPDAGIDGGQGPPGNFLVVCGCGEGGLGPLLFGLILLLALRGHLYRRTVTARVRRLSPARPRSSGGSPPRRSWR